MPSHRTPRRWPAGHQPRWWTERFWSAPRQRRFGWRGKEPRTMNVGSRAISIITRLRGLHHPPCSALMANQVYYLIAAPAYDLMVAIKLLDLNDDCQGWRVKTLMKKLLFLPGRMARRSRQWWRGCWSLVSGCAGGDVGRSGCARRTCRGDLGWSSPASDAVCPEASCVPQHLGLEVGRGGALSGDASEPKNAVSVSTTAPVAPRKSTIWPATRSKRSCPPHSNRQPYSHRNG